MAKLKFRKGLNQLIGQTIQGGAAAVGAMIGVTVGPPIISDAPVTPLNKEQLVSAFVGAALMAAVTFLKKDPVPNFDSNGNTETITKNDN
jgi:hypothetical protein